eukprot:10082703-Ditylum_brightwellii.AAC.1
MEEHERSLLKCKKMSNTVLALELGVCTELGRSVHELGVCIGLGDSYVKTGSVSESRMVGEHNVSYTVG